MIHRKSSAKVENVNIQSILLYTCMTKLLQSDWLGGVQLFH